MITTICEIKDGTYVVNTARSFITDKLDKGNCINITIEDYNGDEYILQIPHKNFPKFIRECLLLKQSLK